MGNQNRDHLRSLFTIKSSEPVKPAAGPIPGPSETLPIIKIAELELDLTEFQGFTYGYGEQLKSEESIGQVSGYAGQRVNDGSSQAEMAKIKNRDGEVIDNKYRIIGPLGAGGASEVYLCERMLVGDKVALKLLRSNFAADPETARRFHLEALTTASIKHPNVITIHDFDFTDSGNPFIVAELLRGQTLLGEQRRAGRIPLRHALQIITPICSALNIAHKHGIVHRDLKPANIVIHRMDDGSEVMKLIDFGIAKQFMEPKMDLKTLPGMVVGTPAYMAPERCMEEPYDTRADIYNLGLILFEMLTGHHPFHAKTMMAMMAKQISEDPPSLREIVPDIPEAIEQIINKSLAKSPNDRFATALEFADELNSAFYASWLN